MISDTGSRVINGEIYKPDRIPLNNEALYYLLNPLNNIRVYGGGIFMAELERIDNPQPIT